MNNIPNFGEYERFFKLKYGLFSTIELNYHFIKSNKKNQRGKDSIHWIAPYMDILLKYSKECDHITEFEIVEDIQSDPGLMIIKRLIYEK